MDKTMLNDIIGEIESRVENIKNYYAFFKIIRSFDQDKYPYDPITIVFGVLALFLYDGKLKLRNLSDKDISVFLQEYIKEAFDKEVTSDEAKGFTYYILDKLQNGGSGITLSYYSHKGKMPREKMTRLIDMRLDEKTNMIHYLITNDGLDFYLKTKEFIEESQITTNLLVFRKQIETRSFELALYTIRDLKLRVQRRIEYKSELLDLLQYGSGEENERYRDFHSSVSLLFQEEEQLFREVFNLLTTMRTEYVEKLNRNLLNQKDKNSLATIDQINHEMQDAMQIHKRLLNEAVEMSAEKEKIRLRRLGAAFSVKFNFETELDRIVQNNLDPESLKAIIHPLLNPRPRKMFNPLKAFASQKILNERQEIAEVEYEDEEPMLAETLNDVFEKQQLHNFRFYTQHLMQMFSRNKCFTLKDWFEALEAETGKDAVMNTDFVPFVILLNRFEKKEGVRVVDMAIILQKSTDKQTLLEKFIVSTPRQIDCFTVTPLKHDVKLGYGIKITNLEFRGETNDSE